jgi:hypothetical protein
MFAIGHLVPAVRSLRWYRSSACRHRLPFRRELLNGVANVWAKLVDIAAACEGLNLLTVQPSILQ